MTLDAIQFSSFFLSVFSFSFFFFFPALFLWSSVMDEHLNFFLVCVIVDEGYLLRILSCFARSLTLLFFFSFFLFLVKSFLRRKHRQ